MASEIDGNTSASSQMHLLMRADSIASPPCPHWRHVAAAVGAIDFGKDTATVAGATFATGAPASGSDGADTTGIAGAAADGAVQA
mmetsp:Transcript_100419/g.139592  ORF Transcript_100419/g.139592 Transcript_100419/m.139592 type:complete len:85 (+) Transcript_100419:192-446(+)